MAAAEMPERPHPALSLDGSWGELRGIDALGCLPEAELRALMQASRRRWFQRGEEVLHRFPPRTVIAIASGGVRLSRSGVTGRAVTLGTFGSGEVCNLAMLGWAAADKGDLTATTPRTCVYGVPAAALCEAATRSPALAAALIRALAGSLAAARDHIEDFALADSKHRIVHAVLRAQGSSGATITHEQLAGMVGMRREDVTRALHRLEVEGVLRLNPGDHSIKILSDDHQ